jgi:hypothetical protein
VAPKSRTLKTVISLEPGREPAQRLDGAAMNERRRIVAKRSFRG